MLAWPAFAMTAVGEAPEAASGSSGRALPDGRSEGVYLVAPIYSFKSHDGADHRSRVKAYAYNTLFWLPGDETCGMLEGCMRLDRVQPVHSSLMEAKPIKLMPDALDALIAWYGAYLTNRIPQRIIEYRSEALKQLGSEQA